MDRDISVSKFTGYEREDRNSILGSGRNYYLHHEVQIGSGFTQFFYHVLSRYKQLERRD
jgi:hypothetical protein